MLIASEPRNGCSMPSLYASATTYLYRAKQITAHTVYNSNRTVAFSMVASLQYAGQASFLSQLQPTLSTKSNSTTRLLRHYCNHHIPQQDTRSTWSLCGQRVGVYNHLLNADVLLRPALLARHWHLLQQVQHLLPVDHLVNNMHAQLLSWVCMYNICVVLLKDEQENKQFMVNLYSRSVHVSAETLC